jgi:hypothetical protein
MMPWKFDPERFRAGDADPQNYVGGIVSSILRQVFG